MTQKREEENKVAEEKSPIDWESTPPLRMLEADDYDREELYAIRQKRLSELGW